jgi:hypothetical protein
VKQDPSTPITPSNIVSKLSKSSKEMYLAAKLEAAGFDVETMLSDFQGNACNQKSALWNLLMEITPDHPRATVTSDKVEINLNEVDRYFERKVDNAENPLLRLAAIGKEPHQEKHKSAELYQPSSGNHDRLNSGGRRGKVSPLAPVEQNTSSPNSQPYKISNSNSAGLLRISCDMKNIGISEEDEEASMSPLLEE